MVNKRSKKTSRKKIPSKITRGGITVVKVGKDDIFLFQGRKLKTGTVGIFGSKGKLRVGVFQGNRKKSRPIKRKLTKTRKTSRSNKRSLK